MTTEEFVQELAKCAPDADILMQRGLSAKDAEEFRHMYFCKPKPFGHKLDDPVLNLLSMYDVSHVEIGGIQFLDPEEIDEGWIVAEDEVDPIILDRQTGELYEEQFDRPGEVLMKCARDSGSFLGALAEAGCFLGNRPRVDEEADQKQLCAKARQCAEIAGGEKYLNFYEMLLGCD